MYRVDSTICCVLPYDNIMPDVMVVIMPLLRLPEMAEIVVDSLLRSSMTPLKDLCKSHQSSSL